MCHFFGRQSSDGFDLDQAVLGGEPGARGRVAREWSLFDLGQRLALGRFDRWDMKPSDAPRSVDKDEPPPQLSRSKAARRIIEEYADQLREIIRKLRRRLQH